MDISERIALDGQDSSAVPQGRGGGEPSQRDAASLRIVVELDVPAVMRDGVTLRANVYRPVGEGRWPTLLSRTPYGKDVVGTHPHLDPIQAARQGFMVVVQDTRGRYASDGEWAPFRHERQDGYDTVEWAAQLPGSNGRVAMFGESYDGNVQWLAALDAPPSLVAIAPALTWADAMDGVFARGGAVELGLVLPWSLGTAEDYVCRLGLDPAERERRRAALIDDIDALAEVGYWGLPVSRPPVLERHGAPEFGAVRAIHDPSVAEWTRVAGRQAQVDVPSLHVGGWYDLALQGTLDNYEAMAGAGREAHLVVGPWTHSTFADPIGDLRFGIRAGRFGGHVHDGLDANGLTLAWLRRHAAEDRSSAAGLPPVRIFVMGRNEWRDEASWPLERAVDQEWFLHADGALSREATDRDRPASAFRYDPADPVITVGGNSLMEETHRAGPIDQRDVERRDDVLVFTSAPLAEDLEVTGRVRVSLWVESSAPSTDWVARLCDVHADGRSIPICDGILRVHEDADAQGRRDIDLWSTSNLFLKGHRLRVHVTSSSFPRWDRNLNTGHQDRPEMAVAEQRVFHGSSTASFIVLPVVPAAI